MDRGESVQQSVVRVVRIHHYIVAVNRVFFCVSSPDRNVPIRDFICFFWDLLRRALPESFIATSVVGFGAAKEVCRSTDIMESARAGC
jgi:hypothetical protein